MDIEHLRRTMRIQRTQMQQISDHLTSELSAYLQFDLKCFKRHIVEGESCVSTVYGRLSQSEPFDCRIEGVVLIQLRSECPPNVAAELIAFSRGERIGLQRQRGGSFLSLRLRFGDGITAWETQGWLGDGPDDWENQTQLRAVRYGSLEETWEDND